MTTSQLHVIPAARIAEFLAGRDHDIQVSDSPQAVGLLLGGRLPAPYRIDTVIRHLRWAFGAVVVNHRNEMGTITGTSTLPGRWPHTAVAVWQQGSHLRVGSMPGH